MARVVKNPSATAGDVRDLSLISGLGRSFVKGNGNPLQYSYLENPMDRGVRQATIHRLQRVRHSWSDVGLKTVSHIIRNLNKF